MPLTLNSTFTLPNSPPTTQPRLGWGSWPSKGETCTKSVLTAISEGYRHFDSAQAYKNEEAIGEAIRQTDVPRSELYLTSKIHASPPFDVEDVYKGIVDSVKKMNGGKEDAYLDLFLIHGAAVDGGKHNKTQWQALERAYKEGIVKAIGVSNAGKGLIEDMKEYAAVWPPHVNQIEVCGRERLKL
jgi:diketogulonate reductase-like aldo/keto reductase